MWRLTSGRSGVLEATRLSGTVGFLAGKAFLVYISNVYDNLPSDEVASIRGRTYLVQARSYLSGQSAGAVAARFGLRQDEIAPFTGRLLRTGPELLAESQPDRFPDLSQAVLFWQATWQALRQAERYLPLEGLDTYQITPALTGEILRPLLAAEGDVRMHVSNGALSSFADTLPLLHPFGRIVCHDSVPECLEQLKTEYYQRRISAAHLTEIHEVAIKAAVKDQERAGIDIVSDGELRRDNDIDYFLAKIPGVHIAPRAAALAVEAVNLVTDGVPATWALHVCYGNRYARPSWEGHYDFLFPAVLGAKVDQLVLEFPRKGLDDLRLIREYAWPSAVGLGVIDVKSPAVETPELVAARISRALEYVDPARLVVNPDCGLRHLAPEVARRKLRAMVAGAAIARSELNTSSANPSPASGERDSHTSGDSHG